MGKRKDERFNTKLYVKLKIDSPPLTCWGVLCDVSENGLFIKSARHLAMGAAVDIEIFMPDLSPCLLKGTVTRVTELAEPGGGFGTGVELTGRNVTYVHLLKFLDCRAKKIPAKTVDKAVELISGIETECGAVETALRTKLERRQNGRS